MGLMLDKKDFYLYIKRRNCYSTLLKTLCAEQSDLCILIYFEKLHALGVSTVLNRNMLQSIPLVFKVSFNQTLNKKKLKRKINGKI